MNAGSRQSITHIWEEYMPGQFIEPHRFLIERPGWDSHVIAAMGVNVETTQLGGVSYYRKKKLADKVRPALWNRMVERALTPFFWMRFNQYCSQLLRERNSRLVHVHFGFTAARVAGIVKSHGRPALCTFYGSDGSAAFRSFRWRHKYKAMFKSFDRMIVLCEPVKQRLVGLGYPADQIRIWNIPAGIEQYPYSERKPSKNVTRFIIAARFVEKKGYSYLLDAFRGLLDSGRRATLTIIGYGPMRPKIEQRVRELDIQAVVQVIDTEIKRGFHELYREALRGHDVFVLPSTTASNGDDEGGPALTMICAQSAGLPVICTPFVGSEVSMKEGVTGFFCRQDDVESLKERMIQMAENPQFWNRFGKAGSEIVRESFGLDQQMKRLVDIYGELLLK